MNLGDHMKRIRKSNHPPFKNKKSNNLENLTHKNQLERHDNIIQDQIKEGIVEKVDEVCEQEIADGEKVFYLPHRPVIRE